MVAIVLATEDSLRPIELAGVVADALDEHLGLHRVIPGQAAGVVDDVSETLHGFEFDVLKGIDLQGRDARLAK